ncbi:MAG: class I SAM-dependent methyltransferase [Eubacteriales bacterium]|nr:class I SAM-dependent methyltransferase [Eubacteriales bacterium]
MQLSLRLKAIADMVTEGNRLVDVGCDHGYLPVYLVMKGRVPSAIAMDVRKGPLMKARENIRQYRLTSYITTRQSDGLKELSEGEGDTLVIAGMGGPLMERILTEGKRVRESFSELILQPQSDVGHFRHFIRKEGWEIVQEEMILEGGKYYPMMRALPMRAVYPDGEAPRWSPCQEAFGRLLLEKRHPVLEAYLQREKELRDRLLQTLSEAGGEAAKRRMEEVKEERRLILDACKYYEDM